jgi:uncharacterized protein (TIGR02147 family)
MGFVSVVKYDDYRVLLHDWFWESKRTNAKFSFRYISRHLGLTSPNHFHLVISQRRHLSVVVLDRLLRLMKLDARDRQYVKSLFRENTAKSDSERESFFKQRLLLRTSRDTAVSSDDQLKVVGHRVAWYLKMGAIVFDSKTRQQIIDLAVQSATFKISPHDVAQAIEILEGARQLEFIDGIARFEGGNILTRWDMDSSDVKRHHASNLSLAMESLAWPIDQRFHTGVTVPCNDELYQAIIGEVRALCLSILERSTKHALSSSDVTKVITMQMALFPYYKFQSAPLESAGESSKK